LNYGQRTQARELRAFEEICDALDIEHRLVAEQPALGQVGGSALTDRNLEIPTRASGDEIPITYVPFRNAQILALATAWAEAVGAGSVWLGAVEEDGAGYPDCREAFFKAFATLIDCGTRPETQIAIRTPLLHLSKAEIVTLGLKLKAPLHLSWSCYAEEAAACGRCESCRLRLRAFDQAGVQDPIHYRADYKSDSNT
jgi:7-cyano-7-deazaguanine synthase